MSIVGVWNYSIALRADLHLLTNLNWTSHMCMSAGFMRRIPKAQFLQGLGKGYPILNIADKLEHI